MGRIEGLKVLKGSFEREIRVSRQLRWIDLDDGTEESPG
jgi:hypothetical protein